MHMIRQLSLLSVIGLVVLTSFAGGGTAEDAARPVPEKAGDYPDCHMFDKKNLPAWAFYVRHADRVVFENVNCRKLAEDARERFVFDDADVQVR